MRLRLHRFFTLSVLILLSFAFARAQAVAEKAGLDPANIKNQEIVRAFESAKAANRLVLLVFDATWCPYCKLLNEETLQNPKVLATLTQYEKVNVDIDANPEDADLFKAKPAGLGGGGIPAIIVLAPDGKELDRTVGFSQAKEFNAFLKKNLKKLK